MAGKTSISRAYAIYLADTWALEVLGLLISYSSLIATITLLARNDGKPLFRWSGLTLNSWVSTLATVLRTSMLFVVSSCLGQWKLIAFSDRRRALFGVTQLDDASRGPAGSLWLVTSPWIGSLAVIGAITTILALAVDPFTQQIIGVQQAQLQQLNANATIARAISFSRAGAEREATTLQLCTMGASNDETVQFCGPSLQISSDFVAQSAITFGLSNSIGTISRNMDVVCPTGNCTWPPFDTLAICSSCTDISPSLYFNETCCDGESMQFTQLNRGGPTAVFGENMGSWQLPNELHLQVGGDVDMASLSTNNRSESIAFQRDEMLLWTMSVIKFANSSSSPEAHATECALSLCIQSHNATVTDSNLVEWSRKSSFTKVADSHQPVVDASGLDPNFGNLVQNMPFKRTDLLLTTPNGQSFSITQASINYLGASLSAVLSQTGLGANANGLYIERSDQASPEAIREVYRTQNVEEMFQNVAASLTNLMRKAENGTDRQLGYSGVSVYNVRWPWLGLSALLVLLTTTFLCLTIFETWRHGLPLWKTSALPLIACGMHLSQPLHTRMTVGEMEEMAKAIRFGIPRGDDSVAFQARSPNLPQHLSPSIELQTHVVDVQEYPRAFADIARRPGYTRLDSATR